MLDSKPDTSKHNSGRYFLFIFSLEGLLEEIELLALLLHYLRYIGEIGTHLETNSRNISMGGKAN